MAPPPATPQPPPAAVHAASDDGIGVATIGIVAFAIALGVCLWRRDELAARGDGWWTWACVSGVVVGVIFRTFASRRARIYHQHAGAARGAPDPIGPDGH